MKIVVVCGEDTVASRARYAEIVSKVKKKGWNAVDMDATRRPVGAILSAEDLFGEKCLYVTSQLHKFSKADFEWLQKNCDNYESNILIFYKGKMGVSLKKALPKSSVFEAFDYPRVIFEFLDSLYPGNAEATVGLYRKLVAEGNDSNFLLAMIAGHARDMYWVEQGTGDVGIPDWRKAKLGRQAKKFGHTSLAGFIQSLALADVDSKSGGRDLRENMELLLVRSLA